MAQEPGSNTRKQASQRVSPKSSSLYHPTLPGLPLQAIHDFIEEFCGGRDALKGFSSGDVKERLIPKFNAEKGMCYSDYLRSQSQDAMNESPDEQPVNNFPSEAALIICHSLEDPFIDLVDALDEYLKGIHCLGEDPLLWIDIFCIDSVKLATAEHWTSAVYDACSRIGNTVVVLSPWDSLHVFRSPLCLYQIYYAGVKGLVLDVAMTKSEMQRFTIVANASKYTVERLFSQHIRLNEQHMTESLVPKGSYDLLLAPFLSSEENTEKFKKVIQTKLAVWIEEFFNNETAFGISKNEIYSEKSLVASQWLQDGLDLFDCTVATQPSEKAMTRSTSTKYRFIDSASTPIGSPSVAAALASGGAHAGGSTSVATESPDNGPRLTSPRVLSSLFTNNAEKETFYTTYLSSTEAKSLGFNHPSVLYVIKELLEHFRITQDYAKAEHWLLEMNNVYATPTATISLPEIMLAVLKLANLYKSLKCFDKSEAVYRELIERMIITFGDQHPNTFAVRQKLADMYLYEGNCRKDVSDRTAYRKALDMYLQVLRFARVTNGLKSHLTLHAVNMVGHLYTVTEQYEQALQFAMKSLEEVMQFHGSSDPVVSLYRSNLNQVRYFYTIAGVFSEGGTPCLHCFDL